MQSDDKSDDSDKTTYQINNDQDRDLHREEKKTFIQSSSSSSSCHEPNNCINENQNSNNNLLPGGVRPWNNRIKLLLKKLGEKSMGYRWMHDQENIHYLKIDEIVNFVQLSINAILTILNSAGLVSLYTNNDYIVIFVLTLTNLVLSAISTIMSGIREKSDYRTIAQNHRDTAYRFTLIYHSIQEQLSLDIKDRQSDKVFMSEKIKEYNDLMQSKQIIRQKIVDKYICETKNTNIYKPVIMTEFENIDIDVDNDVSVDVINVVSDRNSEQNREQKNNIKKSSKQNKINYEINRWIAEV
jgi:hypothetical protein